jgi:chromate reductase, NAD(P)H dehydrogenase (quinone)
MHIAIISGSPRPKSNSMRFARFLETTLTKLDHKVSIINFEKQDIPLVGEGNLKPDQLSTFQQKLINAWDEAALVFFVIPEYNWITSPQFINALHQIGVKEFNHLFDNKVFALAGVSNGRGGRMPAVEMTTMVNKLINFLDKQSIVSPRLYESHETDKNLDEKGEVLGNKTYEKTATAFVEYSLKMAARWHGIEAGS